MWRLSRDPTTAHTPPVRGLERSCPRLSLGADLATDRSEVPFPDGSTWPQQRAIWVSPSGTSGTVDIGSERDSLGFGRSVVGVWSCSRGRDLRLLPRPARPNTDWGMYIHFLGSGGSTELSAGWVTRRVSPRSVRLALTQPRRRPTAPSSPWSRSCAPRPCWSRPVARSPSAEATSWAATPSTSTHATTGPQFTSRPSPSSAASRSSRPDGTANAPAVPRSR